MNTDNTIVMPCCEEEYYDTGGYTAPDFEGVYIGELVYTQWGRHHNKIAFIDLEDGRNLVVTTWNLKTNFFGLNEMAYGTEVEATLKRNGKGRIYMADLRDIEESFEWGEKGCPVL